MRAAQTAILLFHRVRPKVDGHYKLSITPERYQEILELFLRRAEPSTLDDIEERPKRPRFIVTFDDGYADNFEVAAPISSALSVPLTIYVASGVVGTSHGFWWDRLRAICQRAALNPSISLDLELPKTSVAIRLRDERVRDLLWYLHHRLRMLPVENIELCLNDIAAQLGVENYLDPEDRVLSHAQLQELATTRLVSVGAHTVDHSRLSSLSRCQQAQQIEASRRHLESGQHSAVNHFAYPFGGSGDYNADSVAAVAEAGYLTAVTTRSGIVRSWTPRLQLPRIGVYEDTPVHQILHEARLC